MKKTCYLAMLLCCILCLPSKGQDVVIVSKLRLAVHNVGLSLLGNWHYQQVDTTYWRNPKYIDQSVLAQDSKLLSPQQLSLKEHLLGFFYNPQVVSCKNGVITLNTQKKLYRSNNIPMRYRKLVKQYYDTLNDSIAQRKLRGDFDNDEFARNFKFFQDSYSREIQ